MKNVDSFPRILIGAIGSGSGKTLITCALLQILKRKGLRTASFKCGPDYIDPMFHKTVLEVPSRNIDLFLQGEEGAINCLKRGIKEKDIGILEGVMGFYDGYDVKTVKGSSYDICRLTKTPAILVVNCKGMGRSIIPVVKGFCEYSHKGTIKGIILNNISRALFKPISDEIFQETDTPVLGFLPTLKNINFESRHLGLVMPNEISDALELINSVADELEKNLDYENLMRIACEALPFQDKDESVTFSKTVTSEKVSIGIARDEAFCFYYEDNLELLTNMGAELWYFSPIRDRCIPPVSGILFGGGYPELYAKELSENASMRESIKAAAEEGMPILAECGGFLYLQEEMTSPEGASYKMAQVFSGASHMTDSLTHFGYVNVIADKRVPYLYEGECIRGHEFHYYDTTCNGDFCLLKKPYGKRQWKGYQSTGNAYGGFAHLYYPSHPDFIRRFIDKCRK